MAGGAIAKIIEVERRPGRSPVQRVKIISTGCIGFLESDTIHKVGREIGGHPDWPERLQAGGVSMSLSLSRSTAPMAPYAVGALMGGEGGLPEPAVLSRSRQPSHSRGQLMFRVSLKNISVLRCFSPGRRSAKRGRFHKFCCCPVVVVRGDHLHLLHPSAPPLQGLQQ